jgi:hypothetical protein
MSGLASRASSSRLDAAIGRPLPPAPARISAQYGRMDGRDLWYGRDLRWRRRRYALSARRRWALRWLRFPMAITLPGGRRRERYAYLFWRVRLPLWIVPAAAGWLVLSWPGIAAGLCAGILAELVFSYRAPHGTRPVATPGQSWGPNESAGVREPRRPHPTGGAGVAQHPIDPAPPGMD